MEKRKERALAPTAGPLLPELTPKLLREDPEQARELLDALPMEARVQAVLQRSSKERMELILLSEQSEALTQALPAEEWWRTIKEVGEEDTLPLVAMSSDEQLTFLTDLEWWFRETLDPLLVIRWWTLFLEAGPEVMPRWFETADEELLVLSLSKFMEVYTTNPDDAGNEPWRAFRLFTLDDTYYLHFRDPNLAPHLEQVLRVLRDRFGDRYYTILDRARTLVPAEEEETAERLRRGRLLDHGFPEFEEAVAVYAFLSLERRRELEKQAGARPEAEVRPAAAAAPRYDLVKGELPKLLGSALAGIEDPAALEEFRFEFARLANRVLVADAPELSSLEQLRAAVEKVNGYLEIGLEIWSEGNIDQAGRILQRQWLIHIFQAGYSEAIRLQRRAKRLEEEGWFRQVENPLDLLGEPAGPILRGLLRKRPLWYAGPGEKGEGRFREFQARSEMVEAERAIAESEMLGRIFFEALNLPLDALLELGGRNLPALTWSAVLMTALVRGALHQRFAFAPLEAADLPRVLSEILTAPPLRQVRPELCESWAEWLERRLARVDANLVAPGRKFFEQSRLRLEEEFSRLDPDRLDPRFLATLVVNQ
jgi:hypothetical protein